MLLPFVGRRFESNVGLAPAPRRPVNGNCVSNPPILRDFFASERFTPRRYAGVKRAGIVTKT